MRPMVSCFAFFCVVALPATIGATTFSFAGSCDGQRVRLRLKAEDYGDKPEVVAFHVYRRPIAVGCRDAERVTPRPIPREEKTEYVVSITDERVRAGFAYEYTLVGVDAQSREHALPTAIPAWVRCGDAPVAHGFVEKVGRALVVEPACAVSCNPKMPITEWPPDIDAWIGRRIPVLLFGSVDWQEASGPAMLVSDWRLETCTVPVRTTPWGLVKRMFR